jgi:glycosyltransferase involved in cell wall biosynthesis
MRRAGGALVLLAAVFAAINQAVRPKLKVWGATREEHAATYPSEELIEDADDKSTFAVTIGAPPRDVWPWLVQMGTDRAGFYSWDRLDNAGRPSADRIHPEWQDLAVGGRVNTVPGRSWFDVALLEPERTLALRASLDMASGRPYDPAGEPPRAYVDGVWSFHLQPLGNDRTRLVVRTFGKGRPRALNRVADWFFWTTAHWIMQTKQLTELKRRARHNDRAAGAGDRRRSQVTRTYSSPVAGDETFSIAQVTPYGWEEPRETNTYVRRLAQELALLGHGVVVVAPSSSRKLIRESRALIRQAQAAARAAAKAAHNGEVSDAATRAAREALMPPRGEMRVLAVGQAIPFPPARLGGTVALPIDLARTIEDLFALDCFDFVHVHEPYAPSAASAALRQSRALNVGTFHQATERVLSTQVVRRFVELFFGRLDARAATFDHTRDLVSGFFGGEYEIVPPGGDSAAGRPAATATDAEIFFAAVEERAALRILMRALRQLVDVPGWRATIALPAGQIPPARIARRLRERIEFVTSTPEDDVPRLGRADIAVAASAGVAPSPSYLTRLVASGAATVATSLPAYLEVLDEGELGRHFEPGDALTLAQQLQALIEDPALRDRYRSAAAKHSEHFSWRRVASRYDHIYRTVAARRHDPTGNRALRAKLAKGKLIDVDLHMHTNHSHDCATPVDVLLESAKVQGLGAIAVTDHNEISGALAAAEIAGRYGVKVIVGEEVKTKDQGEVIGLFIREKIPRGMSLEETIAAIRAQGGLVYVPHPFDRMHSVPDYENLLKVLDEIDAIEVFNPRVAIGAFNEEAVRFAAKYRIVAGAGSDSHVTQGLGSVRIRMRDFDGPEEFLESLRDADIVRKPSSLFYVQALKFLQTKTGLEPRVPKARAAGAKTRPVGGRAVASSSRKPRAATRRAARKR